MNTYLSKVHQLQVYPIHMRSLPVPFAIGAGSLKIRSVAALSRKHTADRSWTAVFCEEPCILANLDR
jgi:hypothetical protein